MLLYATGNSSDIVSHMSESESEYSPHYKSMRQPLPPVQSPIDIAYMTPAPPTAKAKPPAQKRGAVTARFVRLGAFCVK